MSRVKFCESKMEARTRRLYNALGLLVVRSEKLIESGNSWFSPKQLLGWRCHIVCAGVEHWKGPTWRNLVVPIKLRIPRTRAAVRRWGRSSIDREGKSPDRQLRPQNRRSVHHKEVRTH